jgi:multiple sugar transport system ATP-binding protein
VAEVILRDIRKSFGDKKVIHGANLHINDGEFVVFVGPSGCGKSTLLRLIAGLEEITGGELEIGGKRCNDLPPAKRGVAMVFQSYALYPHLKVRDNMAFALKLAHMKKAEIDKRVNEAAEILQITELLDRKPKEMSGGQRQRVAIGRAIVRKPDVFLFDEPLSNLDASLRVEMRIQIARLHESQKTTSIYVTHDQVEAMTMADRIIVLQGGHVEQFGAPLELYQQPVNGFVAGFIGSPKMNFIEGTLQGADGQRAVVELHGGTIVEAAVDAQDAKKGAGVAVGIRPEHVLLEPPGDMPTIPARVSLVEHLGEQTLLYVESPVSERLLVVRVNDISKAQVGEQVRLGVSPFRAHLFDNVEEREIELVKDGGARETRIEKVRRAFKRHIEKN